MADDLRRFAGRTTRISSEIRKNLKGIVKVAVKSVGRSLIRNTPVDTGFARSNWLASIGAPRTDTVPAHSPGKNLGIAETANASAAEAEINAVVDSAPEDVEFFVTNNTPYLDLLNGGSSKQAPALFVQRAVKAGLDAVRGARVLK